MEISENFEVEIYDNKVFIRSECSSGCEYECTSLNEVGEIVQEYINEYIKGE